MKPIKGIAVDGGCSGNPGQAYYRGVDIETGKELFRCNIGKATNNIAEFLAICSAIKYRSIMKIDLPIYSDSRTALIWVKKKEANSTYSNGRIEIHIKRAEDFLKENRVSNIIKWQTKLWGEIPADFGLK